VLPLNWYLSYEYGILVTDFDAKLIGFAVLSYVSASNEIGSGWKLSYLPAISDINFYFVFAASEWWISGERSIQDCVWLLNLYLLVSLSITYFMKFLWRTCGNFWHFRSLVWIFLLLWADIRHLMKLMGLKWLGTKWILKMSCNHHSSLRDCIQRFICWSLWNTKISSSFTALG